MQRSELGHRAVLDQPLDIGIFPASISGLITFQSAASQPIRRTLRRGESGMYLFPWYFD